MPVDILEALADFCRKNGFSGKGPLSVALVVTQHAMEMGLPLRAEDLITAGGGQVLGLGKSNVQSILNRHGIEKVLAEEGGRTSRGSIGKMRNYVEFLNSQGSLTKQQLKLVEAFWVDQVRLHFQAKPIKVRLDMAKSLRAVVRDLLLQAEDRQRSGSGMQYRGALLQHLVGAKLACLLKPEEISHHSFSTSDQQTGRSADFLIGDVAIHVTTSPGEALIARCRANLDNGLRPVIVTLQKGLTVAEELAANFGLAERIDVFEAEQFVALNLYEFGRFQLDGRKVAVNDFISAYNSIIEQTETDPSLRIELR